MGTKRHGKYYVPMVNTVNRVYLHTLSKYRSGRDISVPGAGCNGAPLTQMQARKGTPAPRTPAGSPVTLARRNHSTRAPRPRTSPPCRTYSAKGSSQVPGQTNLHWSGDQTDKRLHFVMIAPSEILLRSWRLLISL